MRGRVLFDPPQIELADPSFRSPWRKAYLLFLQVVTGRTRDYNDSGRFIVKIGDIASEPH